MKINRHVLKILSLVISVSIIGYFIEVLTYGSEVLEHNVEVVTEFFTIFIFFSIFVVTWYSYNKSRDNHALFIGVAFAIVGFADLFHTLSYHFMPDFVTPNVPHKSAFFWTLGRVLSAVFFLQSAYVYKNTLPTYINKRVLSVSGFVLLIIFSIIGVYYHEYVPAGISGEEYTPFRIIYLLIIAAIISYAIYLYTKRLAEHKNEIFLIYGFVLVYFSDLIYFSFEISAHLLKAFGFYYVFVSMYNSSVELPYNRLAIVEEKLRHSAEIKYKNLFDNANDAIIITDAEDKITSWNHSAELMFGWQAEELIGTELCQLTVPENQLGECDAIFASLISKNNEYVGVEAVRKRKDGTEFDVGITLSVIRDLDGTLMGFSTIIRDISKNKEYENELKKSKDFMETVLDSMNDPISIVDVNNFKIVDVNKVFLNTYGLSRDEVVGKTCHEITHNRDSQCMPPDDLCPLTETLETEKHRVFEHVHNVNGKKHYVEVSTSPIFDEKGDIIQVVHVARDINERKLAEELRLENVRLTLADEAKSEFLATMSHELRTPLNATIGFSELLKLGRAGKLNEKQEHFVDTIIKSGKHLLTLVSNILDLTKIEAGKMELELEKVSLPEIIDDTLSIINVLAEKRNVVIKKEIDPQLDIINCDSHKIKQVLLNILSNAVKFSKHEGGTITVTTWKEGDKANISVSDTGIGIKEKDLGRLFERFEQLDAGITREYGGTGLGLTISKKLVELHGGIIAVESDYGVGSTFTITLPIEAENQVEK